MMTKESSTKFVNFMNPVVEVLVLGRGHISRIVKEHYFYIINIQHIEYYSIKGLKCCFPLSLLRFIFYDVAVDMSF